MLFFDCNEEGSMEVMRVTCDSGCSANLGINYGKDYFQIYEASQYSQYGSGWGDIDNNGRVDLVGINGITWNLQIMIHDGPLFNCSWQNGNLFSIF